MRTRGVVLQGVLAAVGLAAAFLVSGREPRGTPGEEVILEVAPRELERVRYEEASGWVELVRERGGDGALWVREGPRTGTSPSPGRELRANETAERLFARFAPLRAVRSLGVLGERALAEVGLGASTHALTVAWTGGEARFPLAPSTSGWGSPALRRESDGHVFLLSPVLLPDLENAAWRLVDRTLHTFGLEEAETVTVTLGSAARAFQVRARPGRAVELAPREQPDTPDETVRRWHERLWLLSPAREDVLGRGEEPPGGPPRELFHVDYLRRGVLLGRLTVARGGDGGVYMRTEHTAGWARLPPWAESLPLEARAVVEGG